MALDDMSGKWALRVGQERKNLASLLLQRRDIGTRDSRTDSGEPLHSIASVGAGDAGLDIGHFDLHSCLSD